MSLDSEVRKRTDMTGEIGSDQDGIMISSENTVNNTTSLKDNRKWLILNTHLNAAIYSSCFWVQIGVLPVSEGFVNNSLSLIQCDHKLAAVCNSFKIYTKLMYR